MKYLLNRYKILFIIYLPFFIFVMIIGIHKTNYSVTTTGSINNISNVFKIEDGYKSKGSINSVFVYSNDHSTIFQNWCARLDKNAEIDRMGTNYSEFSTNELYEMAKIQKLQSIDASIIAAYEKAHLINPAITVDYTFKGFIVNYLLIDKNQQFKIGDLITKINGVDASNYDDMNYEYHHMLEGSSVTILRGTKSIDLVLNSSSCHYYDGTVLKGHISVYDKYTVNNTAPKLTTIMPDTLGPSAGLAQALGIYNMLVEEDITKGAKICTTGTIEADGKVSTIGGVKEKVVAAFKNNVKLFICPNGNYDEALSQYNKLGKGRSRMKLVKASSLTEALEVLYENC